MLSKLESPGAAALLAGVVCYAFAFTATIFLPATLTNADDPVVVGVDGVKRDVPAYTVEQQKGRESYGKQVCFHCHSQFVRPVNEEDKRFGPVSQTGEYAWDLPHYFGTRRTGPDLHREGGLRTDDWHLAHLYNPRFTVPLSVMPGFTWLFRDNPAAGDVREALSLLDTNGDGVISTKIGDDGGAPPEALAERVRRARVLVENQDPLTRIDRRGVRPVGKGVVDSYAFTEEAEAGDGLVTDYDGGELPDDEARALVTYLQRLGTTIGMWRKPVLAGTPPRTSPFDDASPRPRMSDAMRVHGFHASDAKRVEEAVKARAAYAKAVAAWDAENPLLAQRIGKGRELYQRHCVGCHGEEGRGNGPAARFLLVRPRDFTLGKFKFRSTPVGTLPLDGDLYRALFRGLPGSSMPSWRELADEQLWLLVDYVKSLYEGEKGFNDRTKVTPTSPERFDPEPSREVMRGRAVFLSSAAQCYNCHGLEGRADGPGWNTTTSDWGGVVRPRDFRPRITAADADELYALMGRKLERLVGATAWTTLSQAEGWKALAPKDDATRQAFVKFLLGDGARVRDVLGEDAVKAAFGDRFEALFKRGDDPLDEVRMATATEKDQPALRMRNGVTASDLYRVVMNGIEGTGMKATWDVFWSMEDPKLEWHKSLGRQDKRSNPVQVNGKDVKLSVVTKDPRLKEAGVYEKTNEKGEVEEWIKLQPGDDWALVHYLQWLLCVPRERSGN